MNPSSREENDTRTPAATTAAPSPSRILQLEQENAILREMVAALERSERAARMELEEARARRSGAKTEDERPRAESEEAPGRPARSPSSTDEREKLLGRYQAVRDEVLPRGTLRRRVYGIVAGRLKKLVTGR